jgi:ABC-2 type transport system permease protein
MRDAARRIASEADAAARTFLRKPAAVFFTFVFPLILVAIFGAVVSAGSVGVFGRSQAYYVPGYLAVVVLLTPLSRTSTTVARHRTHRRFEKLATTPLRRWEWFAARAAVDAALVLVASLVILVMLAATGVAVRPSPVLLVAVAVGAAAFSGVGAVLGWLTDSEDGAIAASNGVGIPMLFLGETFLAPELLPTALRPAVALLPVTYFARVVRAATGVTADPSVAPFLVLFAVAVAASVAAVLTLPWTED